MTSSGRFSKKIILGLAMLLAMFSLSARASTAASTEALKQRISGEIEKKFPGARIDIIGGVAFPAGVDAPSRIQSVSLINENQKGEAQLLISGASADGEAQSASAWVRFSAFVPAFVANRRILPGEKLDSESLAIQEVDIAQGMAREYRGILLPKDTDVSKLETRQTILEGQVALSSGVIRIPDVRKGEAVRIRIVSGDMTLSTGGIAEESAYSDNKIRVTTAKSKRELVGMLRSGGIVEVKL